MDLAHLKSSEPTETTVQPTQIDQTFQICDIFMRHFKETARQEYPVQEILRQNALLKTICDKMNNKKHDCHKIEVLDTQEDEENI